MSSSGSRHFKRNQVEQAIVLIEAGRGMRNAVLRANVKRLLDFDRNPEARLFAGTSDTSAFFDGPPPGQGAEIGYRPYQAFALLIGVRLLRSGMPQSRVVMFLRDIRMELERAFTRLADIELTELWPDLSHEELLDRIIDGRLVEKAEQMEFLVAQARPGATPDASAAPDRWELVGGNVGQQDVLLERLAAFSRDGEPAIVLELVNAVHQLLDVLPRTTVRKRGRQ